MKIPKNFNPFRQITQTEAHLIEKAIKRRSSIAARFPLAFAIIATFGLVSTFYGFEKIIDRIDLLANNPWILLATGLTTLGITGAALRKLN